MFQALAIPAFAGSDCFQFQFYFPTFGTEKSPRFKWPLNAEHAVGFGKFSSTLFLIETKSIW